MSSAQQRRKPAGLRRHSLTLAIAGALALSLIPTAQAQVFPATLELSSLNGTTGFRLDGVAVEDRSGSTVSAAGDVNGDGIDDLLIGASDADPNGDNSGSSYVVFGNSSGFAATLDLSSLNGTTGFRLDGVATDDRSGRALSAAGDVNGDGIDDLLIGAWGADQNGTYSGSSYVVFGQSSGFAAALDLSTLNGATGFRLDGAAVLDRSGRPVSAAGDVNGDGIDDLLIGAYVADANGINGSGSSYVVFGQSSAFAATLSLGSLNGTNGFRLDGVATYDVSGIGLSAAGDVNGDGIDDLLIGADLADPNGMSGSGSSYVVFGKSSAFAATMSLGSLNGTNGFRLDGVATGDRSGRAVSGVGDVNGDGIDDLLIGALYADPNSVSSGSSYVVYGQSTGFAATLDLSTLNGTTGFRLDGVAAADHSGVAVSAAGDVNGDGIDDLLIGADSADPNGRLSGSSYVVFGRVPVPAVALTPSSVNFGNVLVGLSSAAQSVSVANTGTADLIIGSLSFSGLNSGDFALSSDTCSSQTIAPTASCSFAVAFSPSAAGARSAQVDIPSNAPSSPDALPLTGNGVPESDISIDNVTLTEGNAVTNAGFTVTRTNNLTAFSVPYSISAGTAQAGSDYTDISGNLAFSAGGGLTQTINVPVVGDLIVEATESATLNLGAVSNTTGVTTITDGSGLLTIDDNDSAVVAFNPVSVSQSEASTPMAFTVSLSNPVQSGVTLNVNSAFGTATAADFTPIVGGTVSFGANSNTSQTVNVVINNDTLDEDDEQFTLALSNLMATGNVTLVAAGATGTIVDDDALPVLSISSPSELEGNAGPTPMNFVLTLTPASGRDVSFTRATADGSATLSDNDYAQLVASSATIPAGSTTLTIPVSINGDTTPEANETFSLMLSGISNASPSPTITGTGAIVNDDSPSASISVAPASVLEDGAANLVYTVALDALAVTTTTVNLSTTGTATTGIDYSGAVNSVSIPIGGASATITIDPSTDAAAEADETAIISVLAGADYTVGAANAATGTITNDDIAGVVITQSGGTTNVTEGGATDSFTVLLTSEPTAPVQIALDLGTQVTAAPTSLSFDPANWDTPQTVTVTAFDDTLFETNPHPGSISFALSSGDADYNAFAIPAVSVSITDNDSAPMISISSPSQPEGDAGPTTMNFLVSLSTVSALPVTFTRETQDGTAMAGSDYVALAAAPASIPAGQQTLTIPVTINGDTVFEGDEGFSLVLTAITNATPSPTISGTGTIVEENPQPTTTTITATTPDPSLVGQPFTVSVDVVASSSSPLGTVSISDGTASCGPVVLVTGTAPTSSASCDVTSTSVGAKTLTATYTPASTAFAASTGTTTHQVNAAATTVSVTGPARSRIKQPTAFDFALAVTAPGGGTPTGTVTLTSGASSCVATLPATSCSLSFDTLGSRAVSASYAGNADYTGSASSGAGDAPTLVFALADIVVSKTNGVSTFSPGELIVYTVQMRNLGPDPAANLRLRDLLPAALPNVLWSCASSGGTTCPQNSGSGDLDETVALFPVGALLNYTLSDNVQGSPPELVNTALVELPADTTIEDPAVGNNSATDIDLLDALFADGFEDAGVNAPNGSYRLPSLALRSALDEVARAVFVLDDAKGEALRVYARVWDEQVQYALARRDSGALRLAAWHSYSDEPMLSWTARSVGSDWVIESVDLR